MLSNKGKAPRTFEIASAAYIDAPPRLLRVGPGAEVIAKWDLKASRNWYDFVVTCAEAPSFQRRIAGHGEDGRPSVSDPLLGRPA